MTITSRINIYDAFHEFLDVPKSIECQTEKHVLRNRFRRWASELQLPENHFQRDSLAHRSDADCVPSRGRPAARETMIGAHSRMTTVSSGPLQPIFHPGVFDKLLRQENSFAKVWKRQKKTHCSVACASQ